LEIKKYAFSLAQDLKKLVKSYKAVRTGSAVYRISVCLKYLNFVFRRAPMADGHLTDEFLESLMPWNEAVMAECRRGSL